MRCLERNKTKAYYKLYRGETAEVDEFGNETGSHTIQYGEAVEFYANISAARGTSDTEMFGVSESYTKTMVLDDPNCPISETSVLWIEEADVTKPHDYIVVQAARSLNSVTYAIRKVDVS